MSMLKQFRNNSLNHVLDWKKVFDQSKTHQDYYSDKDLKYNLQSVIKISIIWPSDLYCLPDMTHIRTWIRYHQYKHSDQVSSCWIKKVRPPEY